MSDKINFNNRHIMRKIENLVSRFIRPSHQVHTTTLSKMKKENEKSDYVSVCPEKHIIKMMDDESSLNIRNTVKPN